MSARPHPSGADHWTRRTPERIKRGVDAPGAKLRPEAIAEIRAIVAARPDVNKSWLARQFGVSRITIWRHIKDM